MRIWLKDIRDQKDMSQEEFADFLNVPRTTYAMIEQGNRNPSVTKAKQMALQLNVEWTIFFENNRHKSSSTDIKSIL